MAIPTCLLGALEPEPWRRLAQLHRQAAVAGLRWCHPAATPLAPGRQAARLLRVQLRQPLLDSPPRVRAACQQGMPLPLPRAHLLP